MPWNLQAHHVNTGYKIGQGVGVGESNGIVQLASEDITKLIKQNK